jgi:hypothetical protein
MGWCSCICLLLTLEDKRVCNCIGWKCDWRVTCVVLQKRLIILALAFFLITLIIIMLILAIVLCTYIYIYMPRLLLLLSSSPYSLIPINQPVKFKLFDGSDTCIAPNVWCQHGDWRIINNQSIVNQLTIKTFCVNGWIA